MKIDDEYYRTHKPRGCIFNCITALARIFGLITLAGLAFVTYLEWLGMDVWNFRIYITIVTIVFAYLELLWILDKCITCCICCFRSEACFYWLCCIPIDNWLKTIIYVALSIPFFVPTWLSPIIRTDVKIVGALLSFTGVLYFIKTFKYKRSNTDEPQEDDSIFHASNPSNRPSTSTQTSIIGINNDNLSSTFTIDQEMNKNH
ncbi:unnamed protein product [Rotaria sp. Silwood2]|nr:unnamed protein product [Rotaria sp. Silwood2]CAF2717371.1 unnamed protein product [Rotaria sp. Silwood2]CAF2973321.1 unnamed protein product [Rotaria sp. Silwood2]CAF3118432.1 unnamed protein product [Rotaria sp. Silwood2]